MLLFEYGNSNPVINIDPNGQFVPLLVGAAVLAYHAWSAYDTYQDVKGAYEEIAVENWKTIRIYCSRRVTLWDHGLQSRQRFY